MRPTNKTPSYKDVPTILRTHEDVYLLLCVVAQKFRTPRYTTRLALKGQSHMDLADDIFLRYMQGKLVPSHRKPMRNGKATRPAIPLFLPVKKYVAYGILVKDMLNLLRCPTSEERAHVTLTTMGEAKCKNM